MVSKKSKRGLRRHLNKEFFFHKYSNAKPIMAVYEVKLALKGSFSRRRHFLEILIHLYSMLNVIYQIRGKTSRNGRTSLYICIT